MKQSQLPGENLALTALLVSIGGSFNFGYQLLIVNPAQDAFLAFLNSSLISEGSRVTKEELDSTWGVVISLFFWGATAGAFLIQMVAERLGRRRGMTLSFFFQSISMGLAVVSYFRNSWLMYAVSRCLLGVTISVSLGIAPMFITECRYDLGVISLATGIVMQLAITVGSIVSMPQLWGTTDSWWKMYAVEGLLTFAVSILCLFIHDSPSYLAYNKEHDAARKAFVFYHGIDDKTADEQLQELCEKTSEPSSGLFQVFIDKPSRRPTLIGCLVMAGMIMSGISAINAFAYEMLLSVGLSSYGAALSNVAICAMTVVGVLVSSLVIDRWGRRSLLLITFSFLAVANILITASMLLFEHTANSLFGWTVVVLICLFNFVFCIGPENCLIFGELVAEKSRGAACTWINVVLNGLRSIFLVVYFPLKSLLGGSLCYLALFLPPCVLSAIILYFYLPETKGRSPEKAAEATKNLPYLRKKNP